MCALVLNTFCCLIFLLLLYASWYVPIPLSGVKRTMSPLDTNTKLSRKIMRSNKNIKQQKVFNTKAHITEN